MAAASHHRNNLSDGVACRSGGGVGGGEALGQLFDVTEPAQHALQFCVVPGDKGGGGDLGCLEPSQRRLALHCLRATA